MNVAIVGCGGIGGWVASLLSKSTKFYDNLILVDGDKVERRNMDRQLFGPHSTGKFKADCVAKQMFSSMRTRTHTVNEYISPDNADDLLAPLGEDGIIIGAVDNNVARSVMLKLADRFNVPCILAGNNFISAESFFYHPLWESTPLDPLQYYPEIGTDPSGDPLNPGCTGEQAEAAPQLALANMAAANHTMRLFWYWTQVYNQQIADMDEAFVNAPYHLMSNETRETVKTIGSEHRHLTPPILKPTEEGEESNDSDNSQTSADTSTSEGTNSGHTVQGMVSTAVRT